MRTDPISLHTCTGKTSIEPTTTKPFKTRSEFTELAELRFLDCDRCGMTQGALIRYVADP